MGFIIVDLDNCISDDEWRIPFIKKDEQLNFNRWHDYHLLAAFDVLCNEHIVRHTKHSIIVSTGRPEHYAAIANCWLQKHDIFIYSMYMRHDNDIRESRYLKQSHLNMILQAINKNEIVVAYDDHPSVIEMYKENGIKAHQIMKHDFELYNKANW